MAIFYYSINLPVTTLEKCFDLRDQTPIFDDKFTKTREESLQSFEHCKQVADDFFAKIPKKYSSNIEKLAYKILQNPSIISFIREKTLLKDTWYHRFWKVETSLGKVLHELQRAQESPYRKILNKKTLIKANKEAKILLKQLPKKENINKASKLTDKIKNKSQINLDQHKLLPTTTTPVKVGEEFQINTYTTNDQIYPSVARLNNSKFAVTWQSDGQDGSSYGIYGQIFNANGTKSGDEFQVNTYTSGDQQKPAVTSLNNGKFAIIWMSNDQDGSGWGVYGQIFNADGTKSGSEFQINTYTTNDQWYPTIANLNNGKFVITWQSVDQDGSGAGIYGQIFNADGTKNGDEFQVNTYTTNDQWYTAVASLDNGKFVITWMSNGQDGSDWGIFGQIFNADGTKSGSEFQINTYTLHNQKYPTVASLSSGKFVVTWHSWGQDGSNYGVYGQIFNADGTKNGKEFQINTYTSDNQWYPAVVSLDSGKFVVTWISIGQDGSDWGIFGQIFNADGTKRGEEFQVNTYTLHNQKYPTVASLSNGKFIITWESAYQDKDNSNGIYGQIFKDNNSPIVQNPIPNQTIQHNSAFIYTVLEDTFFDADEDPLTYKATQTVWLKFNPTTRTFSGTPSNVGILPVKVTAIDTFGDSASSNFTITSTNTAPIVQNPIPNQTIGHNDFFFYTISQKTFLDREKDPLTYSAIQTNGNPLPEWLNFNPITRILSGTPTTDSFSIRIVASDSFGATGYDDFTTTVMNMAPKVLHHIPDQKIEYGKTFHYTVKNNTFIDPDGDSLQFSANKCGGKDLPKWLSFNDASKLFYGYPVDDDKGRYPICLTAKDKYQRTAEDKFTIKVTSSSKENLLLALKVIGIVGAALGGLVTCFGIYMKCHKKYKNRKIMPPEANEHSFSEDKLSLILNEDQSSINT